MSAGDTTSLMSIEDLTPVMTWFPERLAELEPDLGPRAFSFDPPISGQSVDEP